jgi:DNA polymerase I
MTTLLIDADPFIYAAAHATQSTYDWGEGVVSTVAYGEEARDKFKTDIAKVLGHFDAGTRAILCLSDAEPSFRKDFWPAYKGGRGARPLVYKPLREWVLQEYSDTYLRPRLEADDILGILGTHPKIVPGEKVLVASDKDLLQVPGLHFNPQKPADPHRVSTVAGDRLFFTQILTGDSVDNYPGCPGIGPKRADRIIQDAIDASAHLAGTVFHCVWEPIVAAYAKAGLTEHDALIQARCARILQHQDYDFSKKEPKLWQPVK